ncbi:thiol:disulfide interchange protein DsbD 2 [Pseudomonas laurentiana]|uniref:Thiol:disulfide interchange protein DsbD n=1 Tax=Pseudomonas laurentiana TaxID=2364649 RepID=A0A6I5RP62_9PSED|nr:protein-disulfide reductase DsbD [Pseudomonas laurentiana]NES09707.1 protein-disulfide reductase DsbD [Pseudomonas laurentiana]GGU85004.1 thiol:disulfide interchange protein DsbD 2 [Pseudomonas laurentiana]
MRVFLISLLVLFSNLSLAQPFNKPFAQPDFLAVDKAFVFSSERLDSGQTRLHWQITDGYYLYQKRLKFDGLPAEQHPTLPTAQTHTDEFFGESPVYRGELELIVPAQASGQLRMGWQGCADAGLCYPPQTATVALSPADPARSEQASDQALAGDLQHGTLLWSLLAFLGLGVLLAFTPCSLPMLPILAGLVLGNGASARRGWALASVYVLSMALVYAGLGVIAALLGANLQAWLQQPWLLGSLAALFVLLALPMFGAFELQLPNWLRDRLEQAGHNTRGGNLYGAALLGALSGLLMGPCMTAPLAGALLYIAQSGNAVQGALVLFTLGLGMGLPLLLLVTLGNRYLPRPGAWMERIKGFFGFVFLAMALYTLRAVLDPAVWLGLAGAWLIALAWATWTTLQARRPLQALALLLGLWGSLMVVGAAAGGSDPWRPLEPYAGASGGEARAASADAFTTVSDPASLQRELDAANAQGQWVLLDYYADWCVSCKVMEKQVFARSDVLTALNGVRLLRLDVTADTPTSRELLKRYAVPGPPSLIWIGPEGNERRARRITGEIDAPNFLQQWSETRSQG